MPPAFLVHRGCSASNLWPQTSNAPEVLGSMPCALCSMLVAGRQALALCAFASDTKVGIAHDESCLHPLVDISAKKT